VPPDATHGHREGHAHDERSQKLGEESESVTLALGSHLELLARLLGHAAAGDNRQALKTSLRSSSLQLRQGLGDPSPQSTIESKPSLRFEESGEIARAAAAAAAAAAAMYHQTAKAPAELGKSQTASICFEEKADQARHSQHSSQMLAASSASCTETPNGNFDGDELSPTSPRSPTKRSVQNQRSATSTLGNSKEEKAQDRLVLRELRSKTNYGSLAELEASSDSAGHHGPLAFRKLARVVGNAHYEVFWAVVVLVNILTMILEDECAGMRTGHRIGKYDPYGSDEYMDQWFPNEQMAFFVIDCLFCSMFTIELMLTFTYDIWNARLGFISTFRTPFWTNPWDWLDVLIVTSSNLALLASNGAMASSRFLRIFRLVRLLRLVRLVRKIDSLDPLHLLTTALRGAAGAFVFSAMLLILIQTIFAMGLSQALRYAYLSEESPLAEDKQTKLYEYFGTFTRAMITMFELMLANWPTVCRFLMEEIHEVFGLFIVTYKLLVGFGVVGVINGVFIQETFSVAQSDEYIMIRSRLRQMDHHKKSLQRLFQMGDQDRSGYMTREELEHLLETRAIRTWLEALDLRCTDPDMLFSLISRGEAKVSIDDFICGIARLKGGARNIDVIHVLGILRENQTIMVKGLLSVVEELKRSALDASAGCHTNSSDLRARCGTDESAVSSLMMTTETCRWATAEAAASAPLAALAPVR
jgi:hypothetical protein